MILFTNISQLFMKFLSTDLCLPCLNNKIATDSEPGFYTGMISIDLQKTFDTVKHNILLKKMEFIGFSEETTKWFKSCLSNRKFKVNTKIRAWKHPFWSSSRIHFRTTRFSVV